MPSRTACLTIVVVVAVSTVGICHVSTILTLCEDSMNDTSVFVYMITPYLVGHPEQMNLQNYFHLRKSPLVPLRKAADHEDKYMCVYIITLYQVHQCHMDLQEHLLQMLG